VSKSTDRDFRYIRVDDTFVVWLAGVNRFLQLKEPAFFVFEQWAKGKDIRLVSGDCASRYELPAEEALRFSGEIIGEIEKLFKTSQGVQSTELRLSEANSRTKGWDLRAQNSELSSGQQDSQSLSRSLAPAPRQVVRSSSRSLVSEHICLINGKIIHFMYGNEEIEEIFRPLFRQFEADNILKVKPARLNDKRLSNELLSASRSGGVEVEVNVEDKDKVEKKVEIRDMESGEKTSHQRCGISVEKGSPSLSLQADRSEEARFGIKEEANRIEIYTKNGYYCLKINYQEAKLFREEEWEYFHGAVYTELLNIIYKKKLNDWMAVFHASAVSRGEEALLFTGDSGSGKSTLAALMMAHGYRLISDDFVPAALSQPEIYPLPTAISVKKRALPFLKAWFPILAEEEVLLKEEEEDVEVFLPLPEGSRDFLPVRAMAIVFVKYDPSVDYNLTRESNLLVMNDFLKQSWIASNPQAADRFLEWYFSLPVYTLAYSDSEKVVKGLRDLGTKGLRD
jgi:hypothetical protein